jgi:hypothetical protein
LARRAAGKKADLPLLQAHLLKRCLRSKQVDITRLGERPTRSVKSDRLLCGFILLNTKRDTKPCFLKPDI